MTVKLSLDGLTEGESLVDAYTTRVIAALSNLDVLWHTVGVKVQEHILERWTSGVGGFSPLATSTIYAKAKRHGYYRRAPGSASFLRRHGQHAFWWTGKALGRALGEDAFHVGRKALVIDFGRNNEPRKNLERMHFGGKNRPARPVYDINKVTSIAQEWMDKYVERVLEVSNVGTASLRRL